MRFLLLSRDALVSQHVDGLLKTGDLRTRTAQCASTATLGVLKPVALAAVYPYVLGELAENSGGTVRAIGKPFQKGQSGNPGGRPKGVARTVREVCGGSPLRLAQLLFEIAENPKARDRDRIAASTELLNRGWGKAPAFASIEGADPLEQDEISEAISGLVAQLREAREV